MGQSTLKFKNPSDALESRKELVRELQGSNLDSTIKNQLIKDVTEDDLSKFMTDTTDPLIQAAIQAANLGGGDDARA